MTPSPRRSRQPAPTCVILALFAFVVAALWWLGCESRRARTIRGARSESAAAPAASYPSASRATQPHARISPRGSPGEAPPAGGAPPAVTHEPDAAAVQWEPQRPLLPRGPGRVAIIVDDVGYNNAEIEDFTALEYPLTFSVLPGVERSAQLARACAASGCEVMLHLPMEPLSPELNPGPGCIRVDMTDEQIRAAVEHALAAVPQAVGVNNHMGSRATADARVMRAVLSVLRRRGMFFVDSLTTGASVAAEVAADLGVPYAERSVFLDTNFSPEPTDATEFLDAAQERMQQLGRIAQRRGYCIGICHYRPQAAAKHPQTADMLARLLPAVQEAGIEIVSVSSLVGSPSGATFALP